MESRSPAGQEDDFTIQHDPTKPTEGPGIKGERARVRMFSFADRIDQAGNERQERRFQVEYDDKTNGDGCGYTRAHQRVTAAHIRNGEHSTFPASSPR
jgi:hypothetical protein